MTSGRGGKKRIEGHAIDQIDSTIKILQRLFAHGELSGLDKARREILRDQFYMAVANRDLTPEQRDRAVQLLNEFFGDGPAVLSGRLFVVHIESHQRASYPSTPRQKGESAAGNAIEVFELTESEAEEIDQEPGGQGAPPASSSEKGTSGGNVEASKKSEKLGTQGSPRFEGKRVSARSLGKTPSESVKIESVLPKSVSVPIGKDPTDEPVTWDTGKNPNFGFLVTGDSGSGKSQTIRAMIYELRNANCPVLIFDFKNDYSDPSFWEPLGLRVYDVARNGLPFNPMGLLPDERGEVQPIRQCHNFASIVGRVEGLREQQTHRLVEAQRRAYENHGVDPRARLQMDDIHSEPVFDEVLDELRKDDDDVSNSVLYRLQKFSDLGLFPSQPQDYSFDDLLKESVVVTLNDAGNDRLMRILAEILIVKIHAVIKRGPQPRTLQRMLVFDEAWQIAKSHRLVELAREGRAFGVGLLIGTQYPKDLPENLVGCLRTQLYLYNKELDNQKIIVRALCNTTSGPHALRLLNTIQHLDQFQGYLISEQYKEGIRVNVTPHYSRVVG